MKKGDILQVQFPFTNLQGFKQRPALVVAVEAPNVTVAFMTGTLSFKRPYDVIVQPNSLNRLSKPSLVRVVKLATIDSALIYGRVGELTAVELQVVDAGLRQALRL